MSTEALNPGRPKTSVIDSALVAYGIALVAVAIAFLAVWAVRPVPAFPMDDPYITLHSAQVLHWGTDPNWVGVHALYGITSAPFLALIYVLLFVFPPLIALNLACWLGILVYALGLVRLTRAAGLSRFQSILFVLLGLSASTVTFHLLNGLETPWALAAVTWMMAFASGRGRDPRVAAALAGVATCVRPDLLPLAILLVLALAVEIYLSSGSKRLAVQRAAQYSALALVPIFICAFWYYHATGTPFPLTGVAKRYFLAQDNLPWRAKLSLIGWPAFAFAISCGPLLLPLLLSARRVIGAAMLCFFALFTAAIYVQFPSAMQWNWYRYPVVLVPILIWALAGQFSWPGETARRNAARWLYICFIYAILLLPFRMRIYVNWVHRFDTLLRQNADWCEQHLPPGSRLLVHDAGYIAYATHFRTIDIVGLKTPQAIPLNRRYTHATGGAARGEAVSQLAIATGADYLITSPSWPSVVTLPQQMRTLGWRLDPLRTEGGYWVYRLTPPAR